MAAPTWADKIRTREMAFSKFGYLKSLHGVKMPSDKHFRVIVALLDHADADGSSAYPGNQLLAQECCCSVDTVKRALRWAKANGLVILVRQGRRNAGASAWRFPQEGSRAPLYRNHRGADDTVLPASQGGTDAPPPDHYQDGVVSRPLSNGSWPSGEVSESNRSDLRLGSGSIDETSDVASSVGSSSVGLSRGAPSGDDELDSSSTDGPQAPSDDPGAPVVIWTRELVEQHVEWNRVLPTIFPPLPRTDLETT
jgi:hypothetical protein